jgi:hypothetical protein
MALWERVINGAPGKQSNIPLYDILPPICRAPEWVRLDFPSYNHLQWSLKIVSNDLSPWGLKNTYLGTPSMVDPRSPPPVLEGSTARSSIVIEKQSKSQRLW